VHPDKVRVSLERNMRCGVGLCGHCQYRELFICIDGPVLAYARVAGLLGTREL
jgi:NAD(P)H-flavin reductase